MAKPTWLDEELGVLDQVEKQGKPEAPVQPAKKPSPQRKQPTERHAAAVSSYSEPAAPKRKPGPVKEVPDKTYSIPMHPEMWDAAIQMSEAMESKFGVKVSVRQVLAKALETGFKQEYEAFFGKPYKGPTRS